MPAICIIASSDQACSAELAGWLPIAMLLIIATVFALGTLTISALLGRRREGAVKGSAYEAGVEPSGRAHRRFQVRYYIIALIFLLFDIEVVLLFPWAVIFRDQAGQAGSFGLLLLIEMFLFLLILLIGYVYAWRKGVLRFD